MGFSFLLGYLFLLSLGSVTRVSKEDIDALKCLKGVCVLVTAKRNVGQINEQSPPVTGMPFVEAISWHYCLTSCRGTRDVPVVEELR